MDPTKALAELEDLIAQVEAIPTDISSANFPKVAKDIAATISDATDLYLFAVAYFTPTTKMMALAPGASPLARLKSLLADAKANPTIFDWTTLIAPLLALLSSLLPFLRPAPAPVAA